MSKKRKYKALSSQYLIRIMQVFKKNQWSIETSEDISNSLFNRYCKRILDLKENKKRDLMIELTERYLWIPDDKYLEYLIDALIKLMTIKSEISNTTKIYIMPLISPEDKDKIKSSSMVAYLFNSVKLRYHSKLSKYKFIIVDDESKLHSNLKDTDSMIILVDDYIGTGETAEKCILHMIEQGVEKKQIGIISLVAQKLGLDYLSKYDISIAVSVIRNKGISDFYKDEILETNLNLMRDIETKMSIKDKYRLGYGKSEALVTMCRTPNNTLPLFWEESGNMNVAPFPRF